MISTAGERWTLFPDTHGEYDRVARAIEFHLPHTDRFLFEGDIFDGSDPAKLVSLIRSLGAKAVTILGNHEWVLRNALASGMGRPEEWAQLWGSEYERGTLRSYGVADAGKWWDYHRDSNASALRKALLQRGDYEWLMSLPSYFETDSFIAVHAGPELHTPWKQQATILGEMATTESMLYNQPSQLFSFKLASPHSIPAEVDSRIFVTGHSHDNLTVEQRRMVRRICLSSDLEGRAPLYTWTSEDNHIHEHAAA